MSGNAVVILENAIGIFVKRDNGVQPQIVAVVPNLALLVESFFY